MRYACLDGDVNSYNKQLDPDDIKDLSVNSSNLPPTDDRRGEMKESLIAFRQLLIPHQKLSEPVEPGVRRLHDPASVLGRTPASTFLS
jgi:hypothetical protein